MRTYNEELDLNIYLKYILERGGLCNMRALALPLRTDLTS